MTYIFLSSIYRDITFDPFVNKFTNNINNSHSCGGETCQPAEDCVGLDQFVPLRQGNCGELADFCKT